MGLELGSSKILAFHSLMLLTAIVALWRGGAPERWGGGILMVMQFGQVFAAQFIPREYAEVDLASVLNDGFGLLAFGAIALNAKRIWPIWAAALQVLSTSAHFARLLDVEVQPMVYAVMKSLPTFLLLFVVLIGTLLHMWRLRTRGFDPSWQTWPAHAGV